MPLSPGAPESPREGRRDREPEHQLQGPDTRGPVHRHQGTPRGGEGPQVACVWRRRGHGWHRPRGGQVRPPSLVFPQSRR